MKAFKLISAVSLLVPAVALAQPEPSESSAAFDHEVPAVQNAFEIGVGTTYSQGGGKLGGNLGDLRDVATRGGNLEIDLGYRILPQLSVGGYGTLTTFRKGDNLAADTDVFGASAGIQAAWHFRSDHSIDPWVSLGTGWKAIWINPPTGKVTSLQGLELARLQIGADYRVSKDVSFAPVVGGSLSLFVSQDSPMTSDLTEIQDKKVNFTGFAGIAGRFDIGGERR
jgi:hypothetical protein